jgi:RNA ligase
MIYLRDILDVEKLREHINNGVVRGQTHPLYPNLVILNYTEKAQFDRIWDPVTSVCRGLIIDTISPGFAAEHFFDNATVVARAFNKFHNLNTEYAPETTEANLAEHYIDHITDKLDGSLGIIFFYDNLWHVATRGSFDSDQARWATKYLREHLRTTELLHPDAPFPPGWTPVCEIIYAANRIVVSYDYESLVLLAFVNPTDVHEMPRATAERAAGLVGLPIVKKFKKTLSECVAENTTNLEGYVITYTHGVKVKVKFAEYLRLHRILTGLSPIAVWEMKKAQQDHEIRILLEDPTIPAGFKEWLEKWNHKLEMDYLTIQSAASHLFAQAVSLDLVRFVSEIEHLSPCLMVDLDGTECSCKLYNKEQRKALAMWILEATKDVPYLKGFLFAMADDHSIDKMIWDHIRPNGKDVDTFKKDGE